MKASTRHFLEAEWNDDDEELNEFQPRKKKAAAPPNPNDRRQKQKEWGRAMHRYHKQRAQEQRSTNE